jgi:hypothetical protein
MTSECFSDGSKDIKRQSTSAASSETNLLDNMITDNPLIFRICCFCLMRSRHRVDIAKKNGHSNFPNGEIEVISEATMDSTKEIE